MILAPLFETIRAVMAEAFERIGESAAIPDDQFAARVRGHVLDRWYRFTEFGVTSRSDLSAIKIKLGVVPADPVWGTKEGRSTTLDFKGTPLEAASKQ